MRGRLDPGFFRVRLLRGSEGSVDQRIDFVAVIDADIVDSLPGPLEPGADGHAPIVRTVPVRSNRRSVEEIPDPALCGLRVDQGVVRVSREAYQLYVYACTTQTGLDALGVQGGGPEQRVSHFQRNPVRVPGFCQEAARLHRISGVRGSDIPVAAGPVAGSPTHGRLTHW